MAVVICEKCGDMMLAQVGKVGLITGGGTLRWLNQCWCGGEIRRANRQEVEERLAGIEAELTMGDEERAVLDVFKEEVSGGGHDHDSAGECAGSRVSDSDVGGRQEERG